MKKIQGIIVMGIILSLLSALGLTGCEKNDFKPAADAVIAEMNISYSGMMNGSQYYYSLKTEGSDVIFNGDFYSFEDDGTMTNHIYENVTVDPSYMDELQKFAAKTGLVDDMKKYRKPKIEFELLDGDMKNTTIVMSDGNRKTADIIFDSWYHNFFKSIAEVYVEYDCCDSLSNNSDE